jgi:hypothetical protein
MESLREAKPPFQKYLPPLLIKGEGDKGGEVDTNSYKN